MGAYQDNLGISLAKLSSRENTTKHLKEAISAYHEALKKGAESKGLSTGQKLKTIWVAHLQDLESGKANPNISKMQLNH